ncbi:hypothetical protein [Desulfonatronum thioautotrophicum]|uniref:hypothetical protein n=1 Tax=Desulfonatronum thioautotrophicum TaxID=617001 RepID=UPI0005EAEFA0|nr:hypothetical protein [Desulfonatronum thioautotrophicum]
MKHWVWALMFCLAWTGSAGAESFKTLAGIELGSEMDHYWHLVYRDTATEHPDVLFMKEAKLKPWVIPGVRGGSLSYTACRDEELVSRVKIKFAERSESLFRDLFADPTEKLFRDLNRMYRERWGRPDQWLGNPFNTIQAWKWILGKDGPEQVEVVLMYSKVEDVRPGVSIKMTHTTLWDEERACWEQSRDREGMDMNGEKEIRRLEDFIPH